MKEKILNRIYNISIYDAQKLCAFIIVGVYLFAYLYAFGIFDSASANSMESDDFSVYMSTQVFYMGKAFAVAIVSFGILLLENKLFSSIATIVNVVLQIVYLMVIRNRISKTIWSLANKNKSKGGVQYCQNEMDVTLLIILCLIMLMFVAIFTLYKDLKKKDLVQNNIVEKKSKVYALILQVVNVFLVVKLLSLNISYALCSVNAPRMGYLNMEPDLNGVYDVYFDNGMMALVIPFSLFLLIFVNKFIRKECFLLVIGMYILCAKAIKNIIFHVFNLPLSYYNYEMFEIYAEYQKYIRVVIGIFIVSAIWRYVISNIFRLVQIFIN